ncbi:MAG: hypothetical protein B6D59_03070 [Campylobacteraceae bacterium 4484_4]|nr:MAG: hypothetical protein B6D59_03070 [Campylobacteraceae bacterium 4484_4]
MEDLEAILKPRPVWKKAWLWMVVLLFFSGAAILYRSLSPEQEKPLAYITKPLKKGLLEVTVSATGYLKPLRSVDVGSEISGTIEKVMVDENDRVRKGEMLAQIDQTKFRSNLQRLEAALRSARARYAQVQAQFELAKKNYLRDRKLRKETKGRLPMQKQYDSDYSAYLSAKALLSGAEAEIAQAKFAVEAARYDLEKTTIYAPIDGIVLERRIDPGQTVAAAFQTPLLFKLANDLSKMELQVSIDEADIAQIKEGQEARFSVDAYPETKFQASVKSVRINSQMVAGVVTYKTILSVDNRHLKLRPGMSADAQIIVKRLEDTWIVPRAALLYIPVTPQKKVAFGPRNKEKITFDPKPHLWVLREGKPIKIYLKLLGTSGSEAAVESPDLRENDDVILAQEQKE